MAEVTYVMTYFNSPKMMDVHLATWHTYSVNARENMHFIVVDDCSDPPLEIEYANLNLTLLRIEDDIAWNLPGARNLGAHYCKTDWFFMTDTDMLLTAPAADALMSLPRKHKHIVWNLKHRGITPPWLGRVGHCANHVLLSKDMFWRCWGYDEDFSGSYGGQEGHLRSKLFREGAERRMATEVIMYNFGENNEPLVIADAKCSTDDMKTEEGLKRARKISGDKYDRKNGHMDTKKWNTNILRFKWKVVKEFEFGYEKCQIDDSF